MSAWRGGSGPMFLGLASVVALAAAAGAATIERASWRIDVLPPLATAVGDLPNLAGFDLNERGQVAGVASDPDHVAAFRYTPDVGMEDLDPDGRYLSSVRNGGNMNDRGDVLLFTRDATGAQSDIFLYTDDQGHRRLPRGKNDAIRASFRVSPGVRSIPNSRHLCGFVTRPSGGWTPYLYTPEAGWEDLRGAHPRFRQGPGGSLPDVVCKYTNERGDLVFAVSVNGAQEAFVSIGGARPVELPGFAFDINVTGPISENGVVPGLFLDERGRERAYAWLPEEGFIRLPWPRGVRQVAALYATDESVVWGLLGRRRPNDSVFSWTPNGRLRIRVRRLQFRNLARSHGLEFQAITLAAVNGRGAIVGDVQTTSGRPLPYYYSDETGLVDLVEVVAAHGANFEPRGAMDLNDQGQVLLQGESGDPPRGSVAVLSPVPR